MNRRQFLQYSTAWSASLALGTLSSCAHSPKVQLKDGTALDGIRIIDAHAHPGPLPGESSTSIRKMKELGMEASVFAAIGDFVSRSGGPSNLSEYQSTLAQLREVKSVARRGSIKLVLKAADVPISITPNDPPGAILAIEGGDPLKGDPNKVNDFYRIGVRMITLVHYRINELGDIMTSGPKHNGLTTAGRKVVERMQDLGMVVDVAHAHRRTLKDIAEMTSAPLVDSHTIPGGKGRARSWLDMELVAKTGGVICTWSFGHYARDSFYTWAEEIKQMMRSLGREHVGLGTDCGGGKGGELKRIHGFKDIRDLVKLGDAMQKAGLSREAVAAYMGGNFYRVLQNCIG